MPDGMTVDPAVIEQINREVKTFGDKQKEIKDSLERDLKAVRDLAEANATKVGPEIKSQIDALTESILQKQTALETSVGDRIGKVEAGLNRRGMGGFGDESDPEKVNERKNARQFHMMSLAARGQLKAGVPIRDEDIDYAGIKSWNDAFPMYLRSRDDRAIEQKALSVGSDPDGGQWVPTAVSNRIITQVYESSPIRQLATVENISTDALEMPSDLGQIDCGWVGETDPRPVTGTPQVGTIRIPVFEMYAQPQATQKLLEDAAIDVTAWLSNKIAQRFARVEASAFVNGTGIGQPRGFLTYPNGTTLPGTIQQVHSGSATALTSDGLITLMVTLKEPYAPNANWLMQRATVGSVMLLKDGDGQYIWRAGLDGGKPSVLLGSPVMQAADMQPVGANGLAVAFGDFRQAYTIVDRLGITTLRDPFTAKPFVLFYTRRRVGGDVANFEAIKLQIVAV
jgi:HK97 family phage major capsid protein